MKNVELDNEAYELIAVTELDKIAETKICKLIESDLALQTEKHLFQFKSLEDEKKKTKTVIKPGVYNLEQNAAGIVLVDTEIPRSRLLKTSNNSEKILKEFEFFFNRLDVYEELELLKKRGVLLYGPPGLGKTATISEASRILAHSGDSTIISWNASAIRSSDILDFFSTGVEYENVERLVIIIEDIGMSVESYGGAKEVDRSLLNLLDGGNSVVKVPTFFIATTNYAQNLPEPLIRPGRFDEWLEIGYPTPEERVELIEFISKDKLSDEDKDVVTSKDLNEFSIAHLKEIVVRSKRDGLTIKQVVDRLKEHKKKFSKGFSNTTSTGLL